MYKCPNCPFLLSIWLFHTGIVVKCCKGAKTEGKCTRIHSWLHYLMLIYLLMRVATTSKQMSWLFWNNFTNGNAKSGRYGVSLKMADQWANADRVLYINKEIKTRKQFTIKTYLNKQDIHMIKSLIQKVYLMKIFPPTPII